VNVINGGLGFDRVPFISIESQTGFNFEAVAIFRFIPADEIDLNNITIPNGSRIISVVDCVGKYNEQRT
jgi:predicted membrane protein